MKKVDESRLAYLEIIKIDIDYLKHLTTLSTGSIVLVTTFLEKLFTKPIWKPVLVSSLIGFMLSVLTSVVAYTIVVEFDDVPDDSKLPEWAFRMRAGSILITWIGFLIGILSLAIFAIRNFIE